MTGSANVWLLPRLSESRAGRMEVVPLWPLSQGERDAAQSERIAWLFSTDPPVAAQDYDVPDLWERVVAGGFPEALARISHTTLAGYMAMLESLLLVTPLPAWSAHLGKRLDKAPKLFLVDNGLAASLMGLDSPRLEFDATLCGPLLEQFVVSELTK